MSEEGSREINYTGMVPVTRLEEKRNSFSHLLFCRSIVASVEKYFDYPSSEENYSSPSQFAYLAICSRDRKCTRGVVYRERKRERQRHAVGKQFNEE